MTREFERLLAKSTRDERYPLFEETLLGHTTRVVEMSDIIADSIYEGMESAFQINADDLAVWKKTVWIAAWLHDLGKANDHFQNAVRSRSFRQGVRHEKLSLAIALELEEWMNPVWRSLPSWCRKAVMMSVAGHHLKFPDPIKERNGANNLDVTVFFEHVDFRNVLKSGGILLGLADPPVLQSQCYSLLIRGDLNKLVKKLIRETDDLSEVEKKLVAATKSTLMCADLAGSALPAKVGDPALWLEERLGQTLSKEGLNGVVEKRLKGCPPRSFQVRVADSNTRTTLVEAGCGGGKTAAAYMWAAKHADTRRLFFCYPTTGTASEGFAGYMRDPDFDALLVHGRAHVDYKLLDNMPKKNDESERLRLLALEALDLWPSPAVVCTAHTVLGLMENVRRGIYAWPSLARAAFVFDEVHAFSDKLFSYLLRFIETFSGAHVLLMTATLPPSRRSALDKACATRGGIAVIAGPEKRERAPRYRLFRTDREQAKKQAIDMLESGKKVLWICNTVNRARDTLDDLMALGVNAQPYHSRYRYRDRLVRQREVVDGFSPDMPAMIAVTTQVAEMSLDLSADLLISEYAPVSSLIQRLGRLNRFEEEPHSPRDALFFEPDNTAPYDEEALAGVGDWLDRLCGGEPRSQADLAGAFSEVARESEVQDSVAFCGWLDGEWKSRTGERAIEESGYNIEVVMRGDLVEGAAVEMAVPMPFPKGDAWKEWDREGRYLVVPDGMLTYDKFRGARWNNN